jgi:hypothetical protein
MQSIAGSQRQRAWARVVTESKDVTRAMPSPLDDNLEAGPQTTHQEIIYSAGPLANLFETTP